MDLFVYPYGDTILSFYLIEHIAYLFIFILEGGGLSLVFFVVHELSLFVACEELL